MTEENTVEQLQQQQQQQHQTNKRPAAESQEEEEQPYKRQATGGEACFVSVRALISSKDAGIVIGKGGKTCKELKARTMAQIVVSTQQKDSTAPERILTCTGPVESVASALALVSQRILQVLIDALFPSNTL